MLTCVQLLPVIDHLDELKKDHPPARQAIRWLEAEFSKGNRSVQSAAKRLSSILFLLL